MKKTNITVRFKEQRDVPGSDRMSSTISDALVSRIGKLSIDSDGVTYTPNDPEAQCYFYPMGCISGIRYLLEEDTEPANDNGTELTTTPGPLPLPPEQKSKKK